MAITTIWSQGWKSAQSLDLEVDQEDRWKLFISELREGHIRVKEEADSLTWARDKASGTYTAKVGYKVMLPGIE